MLEGQLTAASREYFKPANELFVDASIFPIERERDNKDRSNSHFGGRASQTQKEHHNLNTLRLQSTHTRANKYTQQRSSLI